MHVVCNHFGASVCKLLPAFHCITGCDSTSSCSGVGKESALKVLNSHTACFAKKSLPVKNFHPHMMLC